MADTIIKNQLFSKRQLWQDLMVEAVLGITIVANCKLLTEVITWLNKNRFLSASLCNQMENTLIVFAATFLFKF